jgi:DNA-binding XRE family transcriptional regulator
VVEYWKNIQGYEGLYQVSSLGRVRRLDGIAPGVHRVLKQGYTMQGVPKKLQVHALVCEAWHGPCPDGLECRHLDGDHLHNVPGNLAWGTHTQNMQDKTGHGTQLIGERQPQAKLTEIQVIEIRKSLKPYRTLAKLYGVSEPTIVSIRKGRTWKHLQPPTAVAPVFNVVQD